jgi:hypothetical protein
MSRLASWKRRSLCAGHDAKYNSILFPSGSRDINGKAVILLHRFFGKSVRNQSIARLFCLFRWDKQSKMLATAWPIVSKQRQTLPSDAKPGLLPPVISSQFTMEGKEVAPALPHASTGQAACASLRRVVLARPQRAFAAGCLRMRYFFPFALAARTIRDLSDGDSVISSHRQANERRYLNSTSVAAFDTQHQ